jgi:hypothetical protein
MVENLFRGKTVKSNYRFMFDMLDPSTEGKWEVAEFDVYLPELKLAFEYPFVYRTR